MRTAILVLGIAGLAGTAPGQTPPPAPRAMKVSNGGSSFIGVMVQEIDGDRAKVLKLREEYGVEVTRIESDGPAEKAGLKVGDTIQQYNGQRVEGMEEFKRLVSETPTGREVKLDIVRAGALQTVMVKVGVRPVPIGVMHPMPMPAHAPLPQLEVHMPDIPRSFMTWRSSVLGVDAESLDGQLAEYFGVKEGVLVRSVSKGSAAEKAGIKAGDVITRVDDAKVATPADISGRIRSLHGKQLPVVVMRDHKEMTLSVAVDDDDRSEWWHQEFAPLAQWPGAMHWIQ
jgi:serine protease Do